MVESCWKTRRESLNNLKTFDVLKNKKEVKIFFFYFKNSEFNYCWFCFNSSLLKKKCSSIPSFPQFYKNNLFQSSKWFKFLNFTQKNFQILLIKFLKYFEKFIASELVILLTAFFYFLSLLLYRATIFLFWLQKQQSFFPWKFNLFLCSFLTSELFIVHFNPQENWFCFRIKWEKP